MNMISEISNEVKNIYFMSGEVVDNDFFFFFFFFFFFLI